MLARGNRFDPQSLPANRRQFLIWTADIFQQVRVILCPETLGRGAKTRKCSSEAARSPMPRASRKSMSRDFGIKADDLNPNVRAHQRDGNDLSIIRREFGSIFPNRSIASIRAFNFRDEPVMEFPTDSPEIFAKAFRFGRA